MPNFSVVTVMASGQIAAAHTLRVDTEAEAIACAFDYLDDQPTIELWRDAKTCRSIGSGSAARAA